MNKRKLMLSIVLSVSLLIGLTGCKDNNPLKTKSGEKLKITKSETSQIEYEDFDNGLVSLKIPKG